MQPVSVSSIQYPGTGTEKKEKERKRERENILKLPPDNHRLPREQKRAQERPDEDTDDHVAVEVHRQQHDEIRHCELQHVQERADRVLDEAGAHHDFVLVGSC